MYEAVELTYSQLTNALQSVQQALASINDQEVELTLSIGIKPKHREGSWKALAEAHLRERVRNPHDYRALSIELEGMKNAGYDWKEEYSTLSSLVRFLSRLYKEPVDYGNLWTALERITDKHSELIEASKLYWGKNR